MQNQKVLKTIIIILTIILIILNIFLYLKMRHNWQKMDTSNSYERAGILITSAFRYGALVWGALSILLVWIEYFFINLAIKIFNKFEELKRWVLLLITVFIIGIIFVCLIRIIYLILLMVIK